AGSSATSCGGTCSSCGTSATTTRRGTSSSAPCGSCVSSGSICAWPSRTIAATTTCSTPRASPACTSTPATTSEGRGHRPAARGRRGRGATMTYSIVARDAETGVLGVAVQTCMFAVGSVVPWARPGVGAVATQAISESAYGPRCLDLLASGASARDALEQARAADPAAFLRQVGVVAADGSASAFTGEL